MKEKVLITGASGFLGYHLIQTAIEAGLEVFAAVRKNSNVEHLSEWPLHYLFLNYEDHEQMSRQIAENKIFSQPNDVRLHVTSPLVYT